MNKEIKINNLISEFEIPISQIDEKSNYIENHKKR